MSPGARGRAGGCLPFPSQSWVLRDIFSGTTHSGVELCGATRVLVSLWGRPGAWSAAAAIASSLAVPPSIQVAASRCISPAAPALQSCPAHAAFQSSRPPRGVLLLRQQDCKERDLHPLPGVVLGQLSWPRTGAGCSPMHRILPAGCQLALATSLLQPLILGGSTL